MKFRRPLRITLRALMLWAVAACAQLTVGGSPEARTPQGDSELRYWLENMVWHHNFSRDEIASATGLSNAEIDQALKKFDIRADNRPSRRKEGPLLVMPY